MLCFRETPNASHTSSRLLGNIGFRELPRQKTSKMFPLHLCLSNLLLVVASAPQKKNYTPNSFYAPKLQKKQNKKGPKHMRSWRETRRQRRPRAAQNGDHEGRQEEQPRMEIMKGDKWRETRRQRQPRAREQPRMEITKGDKCRQTRRQRQPRAAQNGNHAGRPMKGDEAAAAAKSSPEWRSWREQPRMEIMKGDKWRETRRQRRQPRAECRSWRGTNEARQGGSGSQE